VSIDTATPALGSQVSTRPTARSDADGLAISAADLERHPPTPGGESLEERTQRIGRELFAGIDRTRPSLFSLRYWDDLVMDWSMADENLKVELFRFIDVLPVLPTDDDVLTSLNAYLDPARVKLPWIARTGMRFARPGSFTGRRIAKLIRSNTTRLAKRFIAGTTPAEVVAAVEKLRDRGITFTMDLLGEATVTEAEADDYLKQYLELLDALGPRAKTWTPHPILDRDHRGPIPPINLSIKISALFSQFDPIDPEGSAEGVARRLREVFRSARRHRAIINLDMEQHDFKDATLHVFKKLLLEPEFRDWPDVGIAMQAYLRGTERDLEDLLATVRKRGTPIWVRLVKGAYWDFETISSRQKHWPIPVWTQKWQSDACYERCTDFLMEHHAWLRPAIASHNLRSLAHALAAAEHLGLEKGAYEIQMLYGMADPLIAPFARRGERVRVYTPFGKLLPGMAYLVRRLLENTSNSSFLRATFAEGETVDDLLRAPAARSAVPEESAMASASTGSGSLAPFVNEAVADFSRATNRDAFARALAEVRTRLGRDYPLVIGGERSAGGGWMPSVNPNDTREVIGRAARGTASDADRAVELAKRAFGTWADTSVMRRADALLKLAAAMRQRKFELAAWMTLECGKQWREADADVCEAIDFCEYYAREMLALATPRHRDVPGEENEYFYIPRGVTVVIAPWNFPLAILCGMAVAPLVAGNPIILKPAEQSPVIAALFADILFSLDLPPGVVSYLPGVGEEVGARLVAHPDVATICFTGSVPVGLAINRSAATPADGQTLVKHVIAEMGGKNAIIVDADADLDEAVKGVVQSAFGFQGQKCSACSRAIVLENCHEPFLARLKEAVSSLSVGPAENPTFALGAVIDDEAQARLKDAVERGKREATLLVAGSAGEAADKGYFVAPHVFANVAPDSFLAQTEFFGPILAVIKVKDLDEALKVANGTKYALTGGMYSRNPKSLARARREFQVGNLYLNRKITGAEVDRQPFGGFKLSGIGAKAGGPDYLKHFLTPRTVTENTLRRGFAPED
jgi:RHH-type proline utilization regulon transcriptional repressor/proline dehydrogenase/delta 1-pyrroline-5-carboxylate dehydrogenase